LLSRKGKREHFTLIYRLTKTAPASPGQD
jgi:hypothetical protein